MNWAGLGWPDLGWAGLGWVGLGWIGLGWVGLGADHRAQPSSRRKFELAQEGIAQYILRQLELPA
ncbi:hypothetical protein EDF62_1278 [Leucobacter luti]|uniref:Uncharacterized protein n=1 Tax=Leucobacter luti TaxID=340320 RepID=A0A4R6S173_9MICO|nr:hypothetical protein EDF62_1278 [Leucobacter luti]